MDKKKLVKRVIEKVVDKKHVEVSLVKSIQDLVKNLKEQDNEEVIKDMILKFFKIRKLDTERQAYVLETLIRTYDLQLVSNIHKKVIKDLIKNNTFIDITVV